MELGKLEVPPQLPEDCKGTKSNNGPLLLRDLALALTLATEEDAPNAVVKHVAVFGAPALLWRCPLPARTAEYLVPMHGRGLGISLQTRQVPPAGPALSRL